MTTLRPGEAKGWLQAVRHEHWLMMDAERRVTGCVCGYVASEDDCGYGDGTVMHIVAAAYPAIARAVATSAITCGEARTVRTTGVSTPMAAWTR